MAEQDGGSSTAMDEDKPETPPAEGAGKDGKPDRKGWIPREQFDRLQATVADLARAVADGAKSKAPEPKKEEPAKLFTRSQLREAVEKQQLTQQEADDLWDRQLIDQARKAGREEADLRLTVTQATQRIDTDLRRYRAAIPNAWKEGTEERAKVAQEFQELVALGQPDSRETELLALRTVFGPSEKLDKPRSKTSVESDEQAAGSGGEDRAKTNDTIKGLDARRKAYYEDQIKVGRYKDWSEVRKELDDYAKRKRA